ncbi:primary ovarian follicle growth [Mactra antiquata]
MDAKEDFHCFTHDGENDSLESISSNPTTPLGPCTPNTVTTADNDIDTSIFSMSMDSGIDSPASYGFQPNTHNVSTHSITSINTRTLKSSEKKKLSTRTKEINPLEHSSKEKRRRERIKGSCHQLRVLLPYINGRKTDMASILEMCVDYLKMVNICMPQSVQQQIVYLMNKEAGQTNKKETVKFEFNKENTPCPIIKPLMPTTESNGVNVPSRVTRPLPMSSICIDPNLSGIANSFDLMGKKHVQFIPSETNDRTTSLDNHLDVELETPIAGHSDITPRFTGTLYSKPITNDKSFSRDCPCSKGSDSYVTAATGQQIYGTFSTNRNTLLEPSMYRSSSYSNTDGPFYQYYPSLVTNLSASSRHYNNNTTEFSTTPNTVQSLSFPSLLSRHDVDTHNDHHSTDVTIV